MVKVYNSKLCLDTATIMLGTRDEFRAHGLDPRRTENYECHPKAKNHLCYAVDIPAGAHYVKLQCDGYDKSILKHFYGPTKIYIGDPCYMAGDEDKVYRDFVDIWDEQLTLPFLSTGSDGLFEIFVAVGGVN